MFIPPFTSPDTQQYSCGFLGWWQYCNRRERTVFWKMIVVSTRAELGGQPPEHAALENRHEHLSQAQLIPKKQRIKNRNILFNKFSQLCLKGYVKVSKLPFIFYFYIISISLMENNFLLKNLTATVSHSKKTLILKCSVTIMESSAYLVVLSVDWSWQVLSICYLILQNTCLSLKHVNS